MPNWKKIITSGSDAQLNSLELNNGATGSFTGSFIGDGSQLTGITATSSPGGSDSQIQYNNGGTLSGTTNFVYDDINQRVGIGTTSPDENLSIYSGGQLNPPNGQLGVGRNSSEKFLISVNDGSGFISYYQDESSGVSHNVFFDINSPGNSSQSFRFRNNGTDLVEIEKTGHVGIGNTSPASKLEVTGNVAIGYTSAAPTNGMIVNGNVGIGTLTPDAKLDVSNTGYAAIFGDSTFTDHWIGIRNSSAGVQIGINDSFNGGSGGMLLKAGGAKNFGIAVNNSGYFNTITESDTSFLIDTDGNVGIGTTSPNDKLEVNGNIRITGNGNIGFGNDSKVIEYIDQNNQSGAGWSGKDGIKLYGDGTVSNLALYVGHIQTQGASEIKGKLTVDQDINLNNSLLSNQQNTDVDTGTETVATVSSSTYDGAFFDYVIKNGTNLRAGTVTAVHDGTNVSFTETSTQDLGNTTDLELSVDLSGGSLRLLATASSNNWSIKTIIRAL